MLTLGGHVVQLALMVFFHYCRLNAATQEYDCCLVKPIYIYTRYVCMHNLQYINNYIAM